MRVNLHKLHFIENMVQWNIKCTRSIFKVSRQRSLHSSTISLTTFWNIYLHSFLPPSVPDENLFIFIFNIDKKSVCRGNMVSPISPPWIIKTSPPKLCPLLDLKEIIANPTSVASSSICGRRFCPLSIR